MPITQFAVQSDQNSLMPFFTFLLWEFFLHFDLRCVSSFPNLTVRPVATLFLWGHGDDSEDDEDDDNTDDEDDDDEAEDENDDDVEDDDEDDDEDVENDVTNNNYPRWKNWHFFSFPGRAMT